MNALLRSLYCTLLTHSDSLHELEHADLATVVVIQVAEQPAEVLCRELLAELGLGASQRGLELRRRQRTPPPSPGAEGRRGGVRGSDRGGGDFVGDEAGEALVLRAEVLPREPREEPAEPMQQRLYAAVWLGVLW
jgi:hypothetical protein